MNGKDIYKFCKLFKTEHITLLDSQLVTPGKCTAITKIFIEILFSAHYIIISNNKYVFIIVIALKQTDHKVDLYC